MNLQGAADSRITNKFVDDPFIFDDNESEKLAIISCVSAQPMHLALACDDCIERNAGVPSRLRVIGNMKFAGRSRSINTFIIAAPFAYD